MNAANRKRTEIDAEIDRLEVEFEKNRKEMQRLADENRRAGNRYGELLNANHDINNRILTLLTERWESEETTLEDKKTMNTNAKVGDKIRIIHLRDEDSGYDGKEGTIEFVDSLGQLHGTWGGLAVIPEVDRFVVIEKAE